MEEEYLGLGHRVYLIYDSAAVPTADHDEHVSSVQSVWAVSSLRVVVSSLQVVISSL